MHIGVPAETRANEARVDAKPETVKKRVSQGHRVTVQSGAGLPASYINDAYATAGAELVDAKTAFPADIGPNVHAPNEAELVRQRADRYAGRFQYRKRRSLGRCRC